MLLWEAATLLFCKFATLQESGAADLQNRPDTILALAGLPSVLDNAEIIWTYEMQWDSAPAGLSTDLTHYARI
jgi:hypothetical protein